jgi:hypothetical protein
MLQPEKQADIPAPPAEEIGGHHDAERMLFARYGAEDRPVPGEGPRVTALSGHAPQHRLDAGGRHGHIGEGQAVGFPPLAEAARRRGEMVEAHILHRQARVDQIVDHQVGDIRLVVAQRRGKGCRHRGLHAGLRLLGQVPAPVVDASTGHGPCCQFRQSPRRQGDRRWAVRIEMMHTPRAVCCGHLRSWSRSFVFRRMSDARACEPRRCLCLHATVYRTWCQSRLTYRFFPATPASHGKPAIFVKKISTKQRKRTVTPTGWSRNDSERTVFRRADGECQSFWTLRPAPRKPDGRPAGPVTPRGARDPIASGRPPRALRHAGR